MTPETKQTVDEILAFFKKVPPPPAWIKTLVGEIERLRAEKQNALDVLHAAEAEIGRLRAALDIARTGLLNIERRSEEARAELSKSAAAR